MDTFLKPVKELCLLKKDYNLRVYNYFFLFCGTLIKHTVWLYGFLALKPMCLN